MLVVVEQMGTIATLLHVALADYDSCTLPSLVRFLMEHDKWLKKKKETHLLCAIMSCHYETPTLIL
jgi:hypothetical protein